MDSRIHFRLLRCSIFAFMIMAVFVIMAVGVAPAHAQGKPGGGVETVTITIGAVPGAQLLDDEDPVYEDRRMVHVDPTLGDACVTSTWNGRLVFSHFDRGANGSGNPLFSQCNLQRPNDARKINLRFPVGSCECSALAPGAGDNDNDGFCDVDIVDEIDGNARIRANDVFKKKLGRGADFNLLFRHGGVSYEVQYEGTAPYEGDEYIKTLDTTGPEDTFRLVEVGGPTLCSGFAFRLGITMERIVVTVPGGS